MKTLRDMGKKGIVECPDTITHICQHCGNKTFEIVQDGNVIHADCTKCGKTFHKELYMYDEDLLKK